MNDNNSAPARAPHALRGMRILVTDDNDYMLQATKFMIEHHGGIISLARNGEEAIAQLRTQAFDCVLMDVSMPVMDGLEAVARIRADRAIAPVRIIGMTGHTDGHTAQACLAAGMDGVIAKPFTLEALCTLLAQPPHP